VTPEVKLAVTLAGLTVGLFAFFWAIALFLQGYLYSQVADRIPLRALVSALLVACGLTGWTYLNTRASHPDKYGVLIGFDRMLTPTTSKDVGEFEAVRRLQTKDEKGQPREQTVKFAWNGRDAFEAADTKAKFELNTSSYMTTALLVPEAAGPARFEARLDGTGRYTPEKVFVDPAGRSIEGTAPRQMQVPSPGALMVGLAVNAGCLLLWLAAFWLGMRFALGHAVGLTAVFGLACVLVLMPLLFNANTPPQRLPVPAATKA
jgi:hypothetical protein